MKPVGVGRLQRQRSPRSRQRWSQQQRSEQAPAAIAIATDSLSQQPSTEWPEAEAAGGSGWDESYLQWKQLASDVQSIVVAISAATAAALVHWGWLAPVVMAARLLLALGLCGFVTHIVIHLARQGQAAAAGALCVKAAQMGSPQAVQQLCTTLLTIGHAAVAAAVTEAAWHVAWAAGLQPYQMAKLLAPPMVAATDAGRVAAVATVQRLLFGARLQPLLMWLLEAMVGDLQRTDAAAALCWEAVQQQGAAVAVGDLLALLIVDGHHRTAAALAQGFYDQGESKEQAAGVLAAAAVQAVEAERVADAVAVDWLLFEEGRLDILADCTAAMEVQQGQAGCTGQLLWHAIATGREQLAAATIHQLLLAGLSPEAAAALEALYAAGQPQQVSRVVAAAAVDAVDGGAAAPVAGACLLLHQHGQVPLLRDMFIAAAHRGWADAAAHACWQALQRDAGSGGEEMLADVAAAMIVRGAAEEAAVLAEQLAMLSSYSPAVVQAASTAIVSAVQGGWAEGVAAVAAQLLHDGYDELLHDIVLHLTETGHATELQRVSEAVVHLRHGHVRIAELAAMLANSNSPVRPSPTSFGPAAM